MKRHGAVSLPLAAALLVGWHGLLLSLPHVHDEPRVPPDTPRCTATLPGSSAVHLHREGAPFQPHVCLTCLVGHTTTTVAASSPTAGLAPVADVPLPPAPRPAAVRLALLARLRAPPTLG